MPFISVLLPAPLPPTSATAVPHASSKDYVVQGADRAVVDVQLLQAQHVVLVFVGMLSHGAPTRS